MNPGGNDTILALERGEVAARCGWSWSSVLATHKPAIDSGKFVVLIQTALHRHSDLPNVPSIADFAKTDEQRQIVKLQCDRVLRTVDRSLCSAKIQIRRSAEIALSWRAQFEFDRFLSYGVA